MELTWPAGWGVFGNLISHNLSTSCMFGISGFVIIAPTFGFLSAVNIKLSGNLQDLLKSRDRFFSIIAHDLRGAVGNIIKFLDLLENEPELAESE
ncbi:MAG: hypothetical protein ACOCWK_07385 [Tangfeifania sp.]